MARVYRWRRLGRTRSIGVAREQSQAVFGEHLARLGKSLGSSVDSFNKAVGSLEQQVLPAARRFPDLGLRMIRELEPIEPVSNLTRAARVGDAQLEPAGTVPPDGASAGEAGSDGPSWSARLHDRARSPARRRLGDMLLAWKTARRANR